MRLLLNRRQRPGAFLVGAHDAGYAGRVSSTALPDGTRAMNLIVDGIARSSLLRVPISTGGGRIPLVIELRRRGISPLLFDG